MGQREKTFSHEEQQQDANELYTLFLHNDEVNTFEFVIETLVDVCRHEPNQAEQCALITHFKGKCDVKHGEFIELESMMNELNRRGLSATINLN
ncbi:MAG: ATP-dependent Clp protease adaptor ClpS [Bacteroidales bacterium]